ncbi:MAG: hypothetical protein H6719_02770 [Sandaracinaceae bacterium]|nr:hypothetical protein [Sandaracinaceae bacterium]
MSDALRDAARVALAELTDPKPGAVTRATLDVWAEGTSELVTLTLREGALSWSTTGGDAHVGAALRWIADGAPAEAARITPPPDAHPRVSWAPPDPNEEASHEVTPRVRLADALDDVVTTIVRVGIANADSPSIAESLERLRKELPLPTPPGVSRWLGRLRNALDAGDTPLVARLLDGASRLAEELRRDRPTAEARRRAVAWLGATPEIGGEERISDRTLVEIAREHLPTSERGGLERRYLVDLRNGEVFREERARADANTSVGPCPRVIQVGLAEVERGGTPRRIRLMQYAVTLDPGREELRRIEANGYRRFSALADRYRDWVAADPGQAEPFAVVVPKAWKTQSGAPVCYDDEGVPLAFARADDPAAVEVLQRLTAPAPRWVGGRLVDVKGLMMMMPCVVAAPDGDGTTLHRLR